MSSLQDQKIKLARRLQSLLQSWNDLESNWVQVELTMANLAEQKAALRHSSEFKELCTRSLGGERGTSIVPLLSYKIDLFEHKTKAIHLNIMAELESLQKKFYQLRLEVEKTIPVQEISTNPSNVVKTHNAYFGWDDIIRWTVDLHTRLQESITAKKSDVGFDKPSLITSVLEKLECLNYSL